MPNLYLPVSSMVISAILLIVYCTKKHVKVMENALYLHMLICIFIDSSLVSTIFYNAYTVYNEPLIVILNKIDYSFLFIWPTSLFLYSFIVIHKKDSDFDKRYKLIRNLAIVVSFVLTVTVWMLNVDIIMLDPLRATAQGAAVYFASAACVVYLIISAVSILINHKKASKQVIPVFVGLVIALVIAFLFTINPYIICVSMGLTVVNLTMYFTIENPDLQMLDIVNIAKDEAQKANQAKTDFLSGMSHEIRTPLNAIVGLAECILHDETLEKAQTDAKDIISASDTLLELVNGILDISKIEAGKMELVNKDYDLVEVATNMVKMVKTRIGDKPIVLNTHYSPDIPGVLFGDEAKVRQIMTNLLTNAVKYTEKGSIDFDIKCTNEANVSYLMITVSDTGRGIKQELLPKLFDKFRRLEEDRNTAIEGTGLGLAITQHLVEMLNGKIEVQSTYGRGSSFCVYLAQTITSMEKIKKEEANQSVHTYPHKKVLVVDDSAINLKVESRILESYKLQITTAQSGNECLNLCALNHYDLILLDDMMPEMTGVEALGKLREDSKFKTPTVVLTANAIEGVREDYLAKEFDDYLAKPMDKNELQRVLNKFLG